MDAFSLIQEFFTHMKCAFCDSAFETDSIQLIRHEDDIYVVSVHCHQCDTPNGVAMVGVGEVQADGMPGQFDFDYGPAPHDYEDPELTEDELERLADFEPVSSNDVIEAHRFIQSLDADWLKHVPEELREGITLQETPEPETVLHTESQDS